MSVIIKTRCFYCFTINLCLKLNKLHHTILKTFTKKNWLRNLTRLHGGVFELEILEILTTALFIKKLLFELEFFLSTADSFS